MSVTLKKKIKTKKFYNSYNVVILNKQKGTVSVLGAYNQLSNNLILDLQKTILAISGGIKFSSSFKKIFVNSTNFMSTKKSIKIKY